MPPLSRLDLPHIVEAIRELYRIIEHPPQEPWHPPLWLVEQYQQTTMGEAGLRRVKNPTHAFLINAATTEVLNQIMPPCHPTKPDCPEITESLLDLRQKVTLIRL